MRTLKNKTNHNNNLTKSQKFRAIYKNLVILFDSQAVHIVIWFRTSFYKFHIQTAT